MTSGKRDPYISDKLRPCIGLGVIPESFCSTCAHPRRVRKFFPRGEWPAKEKELAIPMGQLKSAAGDGSICTP
jgi:hypothetical protein